MPNSSSTHRRDSASPLVQSRHDRRKRAQVVRACDSCRQHRIKCDNNVPCTNCQAKGSQCSNTVLKSTTLPEAYREIERLRRKVHELETELEQSRKRDDNLARSSPPVVGRNSSAPVAFLTPTSQSHGGSPWLREGTHISAGQSTNKTWYGPSSLFYFITRVSTLLGPSVDQPTTPDKLPGPNTMSSLLDEPSTTTMTDGHTSSQIQSVIGEEYLTSMQEEYFIELYWNSFHTAVFPILDETDFKTHYRSLWMTEGDLRRPSALVDIVVAVSMQFGVSVLQASERNCVGERGGSTVIGRRYYLRCQKLLAYELENPSISTIQCQILCSMYLCWANFQNMSDSACGSVVRTAYMLGLHIDPPDTMQSKEREMRRRIWWAVYIQDSKIGMKYGRPNLLQQTNLPGLPQHTSEVAMEAGSNFGPLGGGLTWLSFHYYQATLFQEARQVYVAFFSDGPQAQDKEDALEACVESFSANFTKLTEWTKSVPEALRTKRRDNGSPLSTDSCSLDIELFAPLWLQRQRLLLELMYHNLCINLCRPFITFCSASASTGAEQLAVKCALHAQTLTNVMHQVLSLTTILNGWHEAFQWQWNAAMTLIGFVLAYPGSDLIRNVRKSIDISLRVLELHSRSFAVASVATEVVRRLYIEIDLRQKTDVSASDGRIQRSALAQPTSTNVTSNVEASIVGEAMGPTMLADGVLEGDEVSAASLQNILNMAFDVDQWAEPQMLWPTGNGFDVW